MCLYRHINDQESKLTWLTSDIDSWRGEGTLTPSPSGGPRQADLARLVLTSVVLFSAQSEYG